MPPWFSHKVLTMWVRSELPVGPSKTEVTPRAARVGSRAIRRSSVRNRARRILTSRPISTPQVSGGTLVTGSRAYGQLRQHWSPKFLYSIERRGGGQARGSTQPQRRQHKCRCHRFDGWWFQYSSVVFESRSFRQWLSEWLDIRNGEPGSLQRIKFGPNGFSLLRLWHLRQRRLCRSRECLAHVKRSGTWKRGASG